MPTLSIRREGNTGGRDIASTPWTCEVKDLRHAWNLHAREPGDPTNARHEAVGGPVEEGDEPQSRDRKSTRLNSSHGYRSYAVFCLKKKKMQQSGPAVLEDDVEAQSNACVDRSTVGETRIARCAKLDDLVLVGHASQVGRSTMLFGQ